MGKKIYNILCLTAFLVCSFNSYSQVKATQQVQSQAAVDPGNCTNPVRWYFDSDGDDFGDPNISQIACTKPLNGNWALNGDDCNDDEPEITAIVWYFDGDHDGYGSVYNSVRSCTQPLNYVNNNADCDDTNPNINPNNKWYLNVDVNGDGIVSDMDGAPIMNCTKPAGNYISITDTNNHWIHQVSYDTKGKATTSTRTYFDNLAKSNVSLAKDFSWNKIWGTETNYDTFGRADKTSFIAPSPLSTFDKTNFLKTNAEIVAGSYPAILPINSITANNNYKASQSITVIGAVSPGLTVTVTAPAITLSNTFMISATSGSSFKVTSGFLPDISANSSLANYYSDSNADEPYQATATHPFAQNNYDQLNPGNIINVIGGNRIGSEWKTGYSYTVPAAQEMYYVYGLNYFDGPIVSTNEEVITKFYKSVSVDENGIENITFTDGEGKTLATARSGAEGNIKYPVISLIGTQGYVDVHIPTGITTSDILLMGTGLKVYDLKTGLLVTSSLTGGNAYRIEASTPPTADPKVYINTTNGVLTTSSGALGITYKVNYYDYSVNIYNKTGQLVKSVQPNGYNANSTIVATPGHMVTTAINFITKYTYNTLGQLIEISSSDEGISKFAYRKDGQIRYSQNALQTSTNEVSYINYDGLGRAIENGVIVGNSAIWASAVIAVDSDAVIIGTSVKERTFSVFDYTENTVNEGNSLPTAYSLTIPTIQSLATLAPALASSQNNLSGNVAVTYKADTGSNINAITWYSYDTYGRAEWVAQYNDGVGLKTIHYEYDHNSNITKVLFQKNVGAELFVHRYTYDTNNGVLTKVETATNLTTPNFITHADYSYYKTGELKRINIGQGAQGLDYVYTLGGQLKSINNPSLEPVKDPGGDGLTGSPNASVNADIFGLTLDYNSGDYVRTGTNITTSPTIGPDYSGNIKAARWANKAIPGDFSGSTASQKGYLYEYNRNNWLTNATYGSANTSTADITPTANYSEGGLTYDANGNIQKLKRTNNSGITLDNLQYVYNNKNQLDNITDSAGITADPDDIETQSSGNYGYDLIGQLTRNNNEKLDYIYNTQGLVIEVKKDTHTLVRFFYNERGQRIKKESYSTASPYSLNTTTFYVLDLSGNTMAVYFQPSSSTLVQTDLPIYGLSRLGSYNRASPNVVVYEITDHLGNVRAVVQKTSTGNTTLSALDYYPFGEQLKGRNISGGYRYAFQGQELDTETGMEAFQLRLWDGRIGRWLSVDPYNYEDSPYLGMGNNPINLIDPDGGRPTAYEAALMAAHTYGDSPIKLAGGWSLVDSTSEGSNGLLSNLYKRRKKNGKFEFAQVYAGTQDLIDGLNDLTQSFGLSSQYDEIYNINERINKIYKNHELTFIGHSLGGGLANFSALQTNRASIAFNPAWLSHATLFRYGLLNKSDSKLTNYVLLGEILNVSQHHLTLLLNEKGKNLFIGEQPNTYKTNILEKHTIWPMISSLKFLRDFTLSPVFFQTQIDNTRVAKD